MVTDPISLKSNSLCPLEYFVLLTNSSNLLVPKQVHHHHAPRTQISLGRLLLSLWLRLRSHPVFGDPPHCRYTQQHPQCPSCLSYSFIAFLEKRRFVSNDATLHTGTSTVCSVQLFVPPNTKENKAPHYRPSPLANDQYCGKCSISWRHHVTKQCPSQKTFSVLTKATRMIWASLPNILAISWTNVYPFPDASSPHQAPNDSWLHCDLSAVYPR